MNKIQKLIPIEVSWEVEVSISNFKIKANEDDKLIIEFNAYLGEDKKNIFDDFSEHEIEEKRKNQEHGFDSIFTLENYNEYKYQLMQITFDRFLLFNMIHTANDFEVLSDPNYLLDIPLLLRRYKKDPLLYNKEKEKIWSETGKNPDSQFYIVENSILLNDLAKKLNYNHYLLLGKEAYINIIGYNWDAKSLGALFWY